MNEVPLAQCNKCSSEVPPDHISWDMMYTSTDMAKVLVVGIILGGFLRQLFMWMQIG